MQGGIRSLIFLLTKGTRGPLTPTKYGLEEDQTLTPPNIGGRRGFLI